MGETRVDLQHLLEDLADAYPGDLHETILTEMVANALDSEASRIMILADTTAATLTMIDNGVGMRRADLRRFHDVATSTKTRGAGIGFAGVGIKLGLLVADEVITESRRGKDHVSTSWTLTSRKRAPWRWIPPAGLVQERGTAVQLRLQNALAPVLDAGFLEATLRTHFEPLFDAFFDELLTQHYPNGVRFELNGSDLSRAQSNGAIIAPISLRVGRRRKPSAIGYLVRASDSVPEERRGIAISTYGKVIKRGWDWLGISSPAAERTSGLIEAPELASSLTLNKADFLRAGSRGATYLTYRKALQEVVLRELAQWGDDHSEASQARRRVARPIERDVEHVLGQLANDFPMLAMLVDRRPGGRHMLRTGSGSSSIAALETIDLFAPPTEAEPASPAPLCTPSVSDAAPPPETMPQSGATTSSLGLPEKGARRQRTRLRLSIQFESRPDDPELARLVETTIWVNDAHAAYRRAASSRSEGYHIALSVALALAKVAVEPTQERAFVLEFLERWGRSRAAR